MSNVDETFWPIVDLLEGSMEDADLARLDQALARMDEFEIDAFAFSWGDAHMSLHAVRFEDSDSGVEVDGDTWFNAAVMTIVAGREAWERAIAVSRVEVQFLDFDAPGFVDDDGVGALIQLISDRYRSVTGKTYRPWADAGGILSAPMRPRGYVGVVVADAEQVASAELRRGIDSAVAVITSDRALRVALSSGPLVGSLEIHIVLTGEVLEDDYFQTARVDTGRQVAEVTDIGDMSTHDHGWEVVRATYQRAAERLALPALAGFAALACRNTDIGQVDAGMDLETSLG